MNGLFNFTHLEFSVIFYKNKKIINKPVCNKTPMPDLTVNFKGTCPGQQMFGEHLDVKYRTKKNV